MAERPYSAKGTLRESNGTWTIELDGSTMEQQMTPGASATEGTPVRLLYWNISESPSELETISEIQQLDLSVVAHGLEAEGSLADMRSEFLQRIAQIEQ